MREIDDRDCRHGHADSQQEEIDRLRAERDDLAARVEELRGALVEVASLAPHYPLVKRYGNRPTSGEIYGVSSGWEEDAFITVEGVNKAKAVLSLPTLGAADRLRDEVLEEAAKLIEPKNRPDDWTEYAKVKAECAVLVRAAKSAKGEK